MNSLRISGLRSLTDSGTIRIAPITLLLGENSSGKSTFLRAFPLLRQTVEVRTSEPILWYGRLVDFGSYEESLSTFDKEHGIQFAVELRLDPSFRVVAENQYLAYQDGLSPVQCMVSFRVDKADTSAQAPGIEKIASFVSSAEINVLGTTIQLDLSSPVEFRRLSIDSYDVTDLARSSYAVGRSFAPIPTLYELADEDESELIDGGFEEETEVEVAEQSSKRTFAQELHTHVKHWVHGRTADDSVRRLVGFLKLDFPEQLLASIKKSQQEKGVWRRQVLDWSVDDSDFRLLHRLLWGVRLEEALDDIATAMQKEFGSVTYITPLRAAAERYYRHQGLAVNELDAKGENFAPFLRSLNARDREGLRRWLASALNVYVDVEESRGHVSLYLVDEKTKKRVNLADTGFGYSQLLPIAVQLWLSQSTRRVQPIGLVRSRQPRASIVVIEQPELHLHPRVQAKVADLLARVTQQENRRKTSVIVETHSEALVNRLGKLVAKGEVRAEDVNVVLFNKRDFTQPTQVVTTSFDASGFLQDWPLGFFNYD